MGQTGIIYKATSIITKHCYIGQTIHSLEYRKQVHIKSSKKSKTHFHNALSKYGINSFQWEILYSNVPRSQLNYLESLEVVYHNSYDNGYNSTFGGDSNPMQNPQSVLKMKHSLTGRKIGPFTKDHRQKISVSNKNYWFTHPIEKAKRSSHNSTRKRSLEERQKISNSLKLYFLSHTRKNMKITSQEVVAIRQMRLAGFSIKDIKQKLDLSCSLSHVKGIANGNCRKTL